MQVFLGILAILFIIGLIFTFWQIIVPVLVIVALAFIIPRVVRSIRANRYFSSEQFLTQKAQLAAVVDEHNQIAGYAEEIRRGGSFSIGRSMAGGQSHLAAFENTSVHNYRRDRNVANGQAPNVHTCSLQVARNASNDPLKYLTKYFDIKPDEQRLTQVESLGQEVARLEGATENLSRREQSISASFNPPPFILKHYYDRFMKEAGVTLAPIEVPYPEYIFEYVSAGGNSSQRTRVTLNSQTIDQLVSYLSEKIKFRRSAAGQRALMTARLRQMIKERDGFACRQCRISIAAEPHLLLEVDHIVPVSRGGLSTVDNLQTLCWRCNRTKSNRMPAA